MARSETAVDVCEREIRRWIVNGDVQPGQRLPPERTLAAQLGVNRTTLRSALARLSTARLVSVRQGSGYIVQDYRKVAGLELLPDLTRVGATSPVRVAADLLAVRRQLLRIALEGIEHTGPTDVAPVLRAVERLGELSRTNADVATFAAADHDLFTAILTASGTPVVALCANAVEFALRAVPLLADAMYGDPHDHLVTAWMLARWIERPMSQPLGAVLAAVERSDHGTLTRLSRALSSLDGGPRMQVRLAE